MRFNTYTLNILLILCLLPVIIFSKDLTDIEKLVQEFNTYQPANQDLRAIPDEFLKSFKSASISYLTDPRDVEKARCELAANAKDEVFVSSLIFSHDTNGKKVLAAMLKAKENGADVRLILDSYWIGLPPEVLYYLQQKGIKIKIFNPINFPRDSFINYALNPEATKRMHDKLMITYTNGKGKMILGSSNYWDNSAARGSHTYSLERDIYVEGDVVDDAKEYYKTMWDNGKVVTISHEVNSTTSEINFLGVNIDPYKVAKVEQEFNDLKAQNNFTLDLNASWIKNLRFVKHTYFSHDPPTGKVSGEGASEDIYGIMGLAKKRLSIMNAYIIPTKRFMKVLKDLVSRRKEKPDIVMIGNAAKANNHPAAQYAFERDLPKLVDMGIEAWKYMGVEPDHLYEPKPKQIVFHPKIIVADDITYIGAFNLDPRSQNLNSETGFIVFDHDFADEVQKDFEAFKTRSSLYGKDGKLNPDCKCDGKIPATTLKEKCREYLISVFLRNQI